MSLKLSRILFVAGLLLFAVPGTVMFVLMFVSMIQALGLMGQAVAQLDARQTLAGSLLPGILPACVYALSFSAFWFAAFRFLFGGSEGLRACSLFIWVLAWLAPVIAIVVLLAAPFAPVVVPFLPATSLALLLLVPLIHMMFELSRRNTAETTA